MIAVPSALVAVTRFLEVVKVREVFIERLLPIISLYPRVRSTPELFVEPMFAVGIVAVPRYKLTEGVKSSPSTRFSK